MTNQRPRYLLPIEVSVAIITIRRFLADQAIGECRIVATGAEFDGHGAPGSPAGFDAAALAQRVDAARDLAQLLQTSRDLRRALRQYGRHLPICASARGCSCDCGLSDYLDGSHYLQERE